MNRKEIPDNAIATIAKHICDKNSKSYQIPTIGLDENIETPQIFEICAFPQIDNTECKFFAIDGSYNSEQFYNGLSIGIYTAGYICYYKGKQIRLNEIDDPLILGKSYYPLNILITNKENLYDIFDELLSLKPVSEFVRFLDDEPENIFAYSKEAVCNTLPTLLAFCQEILEWSLIYEISTLNILKAGDFILRDGTLRPMQIKQKYLIKLGKLLSIKQIYIVAITKQSPLKMELSYTFKQIDIYLQDELKNKYPFKENDPKRKKLCCWFEVPDSVLLSAYGSMFARKAIKGGRGFGLFFVARLDYVEKLQNYDWVVVDINIFDAIPGIEENRFERSKNKLNFIFKELTRLTQEHYILGYPYPLVEAHNFVSLKKNFKDEIVSRVKYSLYRDQRMDHVDIENLFLDIHDRF